MEKARVIQFRQGRRSQKPRHFIIEIPSCNTREKAEKFVGKKAEWKSEAKEPKTIKGEISSPHGNKGLLRVVFEKGLPGQSIGTEVEVKA